MKKNLFLIASFFVIAVLLSFSFKPDLKVLEISKLSQIKSIEVGSMPGQAYTAWCPDRSKTIIVCGAGLLNCTPIGICPKQY